MNLKSETRNPKSEGIPQGYTHMSQAGALARRHDSHQMSESGSAIRSSGFGFLSALGLRISAVTLLLCAPAAFACSACYGKSDSALAQGMNWGIYTLLGFIGLVLVGVAGFFVFIIRRAAAMTPVPESVPASSPL